MNQLTIEQAHEELNSLVDEIAVNLDQLDSGRFEANKHLIVTMLNWHICFLVWANFVNDNFTGCSSSSIKEYFFKIVVLVRVCFVP